MLTRATIEQAQPRARRYELPDREGLVLRVAPGGTKTWAVYLYRANRRRRVTLGRWPKLGLAAARRERDRIHAQRRRGDDMPLVTLAHLYLQDARSRKRSADLDERRIWRAILPVRVHVGTAVQRLADVELARITREHVYAVTDPIRERGATEQAARVHAVLRALLAFGVRRGLIGTNPAAAAGIRQGPPRSRILTLDELATWWPFVQACPSPAAHLALAMVLATAARITEVVSIERHDLDDTGRTWLIPAKKAKTGNPHAVPLSSLAREIIEHARHEWPDSRWLLPVSADTVRRHCRETVEAAGLQRLTPHDVRRSTATEIARLGYERIVVDRILGHVDASVGGIYDLHDREQEQRQALEAWAERVRSVVKGGPRGTYFNFGPHPHPDLTQATEETAETCGPASP